jgi:hypothetical protein
MHELLKHYWSHIYLSRRHPYIYNVFKTRIICYYWVSIFFGTMLSTNYWINGVLFLGRKWRLRLSYMSKKTSL